VTAPNVVYSEAFDPRGYGVLLRAASLVLAVALGSACTGSGSTTNGGTPGNEPGPAFEMAVLGEVACPSEVTATACFRVSITNHGTAGQGTCTLWADISTSNGDDSVAGPQLLVNDLASGARFVDVLAWTTALPAQTVLFYRGLCDPGLRS
jgi:hypothetical protein